MLPSPFSTQALTETNQKIINNINVYISTIIINNITAYTTTIIINNITAYTTTIIINNITAYIITITICCYCSTGTRFYISSYYFLFLQLHKLMRRLK